MLPAQAPRLLFIHTEAVKVDERPADWHIDPGSGVINQIQHNMISFMFRMEINYAAVTNTFYQPLEKLAALRMRIADVHEPAICSPVDIGNHQHHITVI